MVVVSDFGANWLRRGFPESAHKIHRVYNGLDLSVFKQATPGAEPVRLLSIGRLIEKKGFKFLIEACRLLRSSGFSFVCQIVGEGPEHDHLQEAIQQSSTIRYSPAKGRLTANRARGDPCPKLHLCLSGDPRQCRRYRQSSNGSDRGHGEQPADCRNQGSLAFRKSSSTTKTESWFRRKIRLNWPARFARWPAIKLYRNASVEPPAGLPKKSLLSSIRSAI